MAVNIKLKRSAVPGNIPTTSQLELGELALNTYDGRAFFKKDDGTQSIVELASTSSTVASASYAAYAALAGTASVALNAISSSYALSASYAATATSASYAISSSNSINTISASYALSASFATTSSYASNFNVSGNLVVGGDITAKSLHVQTVTSSIIYSSGSNVFGDATNDTQTLIGTVNISGSLNVTGSTTINSLTGSLYGTASWALDAVNAINAPRYTLTSSFQSFTQSYYTDSASVSTRVTNLEQFSASILNYTSSTDAKIASIYNATSSLQSATASLNDFSASILNYTSSTDAKITALNLATASLNAQTSSLLNYTASNDAKIASIYNATSSLQSSTSSLNAFSESILNYTASNNANISSLNAQTASLLNYTASNNASIAAIYAQTASLLNYTASTDAKITSIYNATSSLQYATASLNAFSASMLAFTASHSTGSYTGSFRGEFTGSFSGSLNNLQGTPTHIPFFSSSQVLADSAIYQVSESSIAINQNAVTTAAPEALYVWQPSTSSFNVISGKGNLDTYLQLNIQNTNQGASASSDIVATANNGNENTNYIDMGINSENFSGFLGGPNDAYVYAAGNEFHIGNITPNKHLGFFVGGGNVDTGNKFALYPNNQHQMTGSLDVSGSVKAFSFTGSLLGTASFANNATSASFASTASYINPLNQLVIITGSLIQGLEGNIATGEYSHAEGSITKATGDYSHAEGDNTQAKGNYSHAEGQETIASGSYSHAEGYQTIALANHQHVQGQFNATSSVPAAFIVGNGTDNNNRSNLIYAAGNEVQISGSLQVLGSITGSLNGTASWAQNALTASSADNFLVRGTLTATTIIAQTITSSVSFITGSTKFGTITSNTHQFTGSVSVSGSLAVNNSNVILTNQTSSMSVLSASYANNATSASYALTSSYADVAASGTGSFTGSFRGTITGSLLGTASYAVSALNANSALFATDALYATSAGSATSASYALSASYAFNAASASFASSGTGNFSGSFSGSFFGSGAGLTNISASSVVGLNLSQIASGSVTASVDPNGFKVNSNATISGSTQITGSLGVTGSVSITGSGTILSANVDAISFTGSFAQSGSVTVVGGVSATSFTGSLLGTASFAVSASQAQNAVTASYVLNAVSASFASTASFVTTAQTASFVQNAVSASFASTASFVTLAQTASFVTTAQTASFVTLAQTASFVQTAQTASLALTASSADNFLVRGTLTAQTIIAQTITSSTDFVTGSTRFGTLTTNTHQFTGSVTVSGSLAANGSNVILTNQTSSMSVLSASFASTASFVRNAQTASFVSTASFATTASFASTASFVSGAVYTTGNQTIAGGKTFTDNTTFNGIIYMDGVGSSNSMLSFKQPSTLGYPGPGYSGVGAFSNNQIQLYYNQGGLDYKVVTFNSSNVALNDTVTLNFPVTGGTLLVSNLLTGSVATSSLALTASYVLNAVSASYAVNADLLDGKDSTTFATTGSNIFRGTQTVTGSLFTSGSNTLVGNTVLSGSVDISGSTTIKGITNFSDSSTTITGSLLVSGSTTQIGNNTLTGNTVLSGSLIVSGSQGLPTATIGFFGDVDVTGTIGLLPVNKNIDTTLSGSYIYVSGSTNDLYFSQNNAGYSNVTRLRWLESNLYTGILSGGIITSTPGSTTWNISSGSGIIVTQNASTSSAPYPTVQFVNWDNLTNIPITNSGSAKLTYVGIDNTGTPVQQVVPWGSTDINQFDTQINLGVVLHLSGSVSTGVFSSPQISYGQPQKADDFFRAFGPLKISGHTLSPSGSSPTLSIKKTGGNAYKEGANYRFNANHPSTTVENDINVSKIYRYYLSGSTPVIDTGVGAAGYTAIDNTQYVDTTTGNLATVGNSNWSIQRVFWIPNSPTNAFIVYYGNARYSTLLNAVNAKDSEPFVEAPNTATNAIFLGYIIIEGGSGRDLLNASETTIIPGGLFRSVGGVGSSGTSPVSNTLAGLSDVSIPGRTAGDLLYYNGSQWVNSKGLTGNYSITGSLGVSGSITANLTGTASLATSASFASTASFVNLAQTASFVTTAQTASFVQTAQTASYVLNAVSSSFATTASYVQNAVSSSFASTASLAPLYLPLAGGTMTGDINAAGRTFTFQYLVLGSGTTEARISTDGGKPIRFFPTSGTEATRFFANGNVKIQTGGTYVDDGFKLDVSGSARVSGNTQITGSLTVATGSGIEFQVTNTGVKIGNVITDTHTVTGSLNISGSTTATNFTASNLLVNGTITAQTLVVQTITSSVELVTGSLTVSGSLDAFGGVTGSLLGTASFANSSSVAISSSFAITSSYAISASYADSSSFATTSSYAISASCADSASFTTTASYAISASVATSSSFATSASSAESSSYLKGQEIYVNEIYPTTGNFANRIFTENTNLGFGGIGDTVIYTSLFDINLYPGAGTRAVKITGSLGVSNGITGSLFGTASFAISSSYAVSASYADTAVSASYALTASNIEGGAANYLPLWLDNTKLTSSIVYQNATGIGVNDVVPTHRFQVNGDALIYNSNSTLNSTKYSLLPTLNITTVGTETNQYANVGIYGSLGFSATASTFTPLDKSFVSAFFGNVVKSGAGNVAGKMSSYAAGSNLSGTGNITTLAGFRAYAPLQSFAAPSFTGTITNYIGLLVDDITGTTDIGSRVTNKWGIYQSGSLDKNYFAGSTIFAGGLTGSLEGTASYALTASFAMNGGGGGLSALYIQDEGVTQGTASYIDFTGTGVTATVTGGTASISITGGGGTSEGRSVVHTQASPSTTWTFNHNLNSQYLVYDVYDSSGNAIIPANVNASTTNTLIITFGVATAGYAVATVGGGLPFISGSFNGYVLTASGSTAAWAPPSSLSVLSASYAATASFVQNAQTASFVTLAQTASYVLNAVSASHAVTASSADNFLVRGTLTAQTIIAQTITSSTDFITGSTRFGSLLSNTHQFTGSVSMTGSLAVNNSNVILANQTSSMSVATASFVTLAQTASYVLNAVSASFAQTASFVNTLNQNVIITGSLTVGQTTTGASENTLTLGPAPAGGAGEGGQLLLAASGGLYASASMLDNWQNQTRLLRGTNAGSDAVIASFNMHSGQVTFPRYTGSGAFTGTATANLSIDSGGNIITTAIGSSLTGGATNYIARWSSSTTLTTGSLFDNGTNVGIGTTTPSYKLDVSGDIRATGAVYANANGQMYFRGGDDAELWDINVTNTLGVYGQQDSTVGSIKLGSGGGTISGRSGNIGVGIITPNSASLHVNGNVFATSFTGSLFGTASFASNATTSSFALVATSASFAATASYATNLTVANTLILDATLTDYATVASSIVGSNNLFTQNTGSYTSAFFKYTVRNGSNTRAGEVISTWNGTSTAFTDFSTVDIGDTSAVTASISIVSGQVQFNIQTNSSGWSIKSIGTFM
jgi:hypothetical protein